MQATNKKSLIAIVSFAAIFSVVIASAITSCKKGLPLSCYSSTFHNKHKDDICTQDCPGVVGCDGKDYCNECSMHAHGIKKTK